MVKPPIVWGTLSFREEGRPNQKKKICAKNFFFFFWKLFNFFDYSNPLIKPATEQPPQFHLLFSPILQNFLHL